MVLPIRVQRSYSDPFDALPNEFGTLMNRIFNQGNGSNLAPYGVDVREDTDHLYVEAELPGFKKDEVEITLENATLSISAQRKEAPAEENKGDWLLRERRYTRFARSFNLPPTIDGNTVDAKLEEGVLKVTLNKRAETKPRKINVV